MFRRLLRFTVRVGLLAAAVALVVKLLEDKPAPEVIAAPPRPEPPRPEPPRPVPPRVEVSWVEPHGTVCPPSHPIKAKLGSKVFRKPESPGYDTSKPDRCYASEAEAARAGFHEARR
ncbi:MAG TPA: hypothetical protein VHC63_07960 [Acidimicrobiales bacterium]|nr:hypothetical protein [Acidimicrobiales bacterium]